MKKPVQSNVVIGKKEMKDTYGYKWLVPMNVTYNPELA
jgi:hypothetical protein